MNEGRRKFYIATKAVFWKRYENHSIPHYCFEIVEACRRCRLFFDIDICKQTNPKFEKRSSMKIFIQYICTMVKKLLNRDITTSNILQLEASTSEKVSFHLIVHGFVLENILHCQVFVERMARNLENILKIPRMQKIEGTELTLNDFQQLKVKSSNGGDAFIFDRSVYKVNQQFRLIYSSKRGKENPLVVASSNLFPISNKMCLFDDSLLSFDIFSPVSTVESSKKHMDSYNTPSMSITLPTTLDDFVLAYVRSFEEKAELGRKSMKNNCLKYDISGSRWCHSIGRHHKSNRIYIIVDIEKCILYQRCYDLECGTHISPPMDFPANLSPYLNLFIGNSEDDLDNALLTMPMP